MMLKVGSLVLFLLAWGPWAASVHGEPLPAVAVIENFHGTLLSVMKEKVDYRTRYNRLSSVIEKSFDLAFVSKTVLGRYWETLKPEEQSTFTQVFSKLSIATYAANFDTYSGETFKVVSEKETGSGLREVKTKLVKSNGEEVSLNYMLHLVGKEWRVINVIAEGVSDLALKRADYTSFLKTKGFSALIAKLNEKIAQYAHGPK